MSPTPPPVIENQALWFDLSTLQDNYHYNKVQNDTPAFKVFVENIIIPSAMNFVQSFTGWYWATPPDSILLVAMNYAVNKILADDENVKIAQARAQPSFTVAGDTVNLDLTIGRNPFLSTEDEVTLMDWREASEQSLRVDKVTVRTQGQEYEAALGRGSSSNDYIRRDGAGLPGYFRT